MEILCSFLRRPIRGENSGDCELNVGYFLRLKCRPLYLIMPFSCYDYLTVSFSHIAYSSHWQSIKNLTLMCIGCKILLAARNITLVWRSGYKRERDLKSFKVSKWPVTHDFGQKNWKIPLSSFLLEIGLKMLFGCILDNK